MTYQEVLEIHAILIDKFGGANGVRDEGLLQSAIFRPFATFDGIDLYPSPVDKAAAIFESIVMNHPFIDGNKRTGYFLMRLILLESGLDIEASQADKYDFVIDVTKGKHTTESIVGWIALRIVSGK